MAYQIWSFSSMSNDVFFFANTDSNIEKGEGWYSMFAKQDALTKEGKQIIAERAITFATKKEANKLLRILKKDSKDYYNGARWELLEV